MGSQSFSKYFILNHTEHSFFNASSSSVGSFLPNNTMSLNLAVDSISISSTKHLLTSNCNHYECSGTSDLDLDYDNRLVNYQHEDSFKADILSGSSTTPPPSPIILCPPAAPKFFFKKKSGFPSKSVSFICHIFLIFVICQETT